MPIQSRGLRFIITGVMNTVVGNGTIILLIWLGVMPEISNVVGYTLGLCLSFILNRNWVFRAHKQDTLKQGFRFLCAFMLAYSLNLIILSFSYRILGIPPMIAQIFASTAYTITFYFLNKHLTFSAKHNRDKNKG